MGAQQKSVVIYGAGLLAQQVCYILQTHWSKKYNILGFIDDTKPANTVVAGHLCTLGSLSDQVSSSETKPDQVSLIFAIGYSNMAGRHAAFRRAKELGYSFETVIHPKSHVEPNVHLGEGSIVAAGAVIDQGVSTGPINYVDVNLLIGEQAVIGTNNYIAAGSIIGGHTKIGSDCFFGLGSLVLDQMTVGNSCFVGARAIVYRNLGDAQKLIYLPQQRNFDLKEAE